MVEFRRINTTLAVILLLRFTAAVPGQNPLSLSLSVRAGHRVTLPCECAHVIKPQHQCDGTVWVHSRDGRTTIELIAHGRINTNVISKADRLSVTENCSLVVKNITREDAGLYSCRQFPKSGGNQQGPDSQVFLSVIIMTLDKHDDMVTLFCTVLTYGECTHTVKWAHEGNQDVVEMRLAACSSIVIFSSHLDQKLLKCNVTDTKTGETLLCGVGPQSSCQKTGSTPAGRNDPPGPGWLRFIVVSVGLASLIIIVVTVTIRTRAKGNRAQTGDNAVHNDEDEGVVTYENVGEASASIRLH
ncbi:uncharacterized protein [Pseudochaenichthys georgianus]|uniref:uncharacterized protein isoform X2 n=1 Tax=Pseudochaenichthys georgianus TaxID=52239 RepID=UPI00146BF7B9|nr:uncharacterized protein LOC117443408 isoform X2 [Pseudochaenichthys georgianus]XP_033935276.1 uncharacterized protein LOC117443408 isoform X2 [Pseudochaenichthys georgianus]